MDSQTTDDTTASEGFSSTSYGNIIALQMQGPSSQSDIREVEAHLSRIQTAGHGGLESVSCPENQVEKTKKKKAKISPGG